MVLDPARPIAQVARELGLNEGTLGSWVNAWRKEHTDDEAALTCPSAPGFVSSSVRSAACACRTVF